MHNHLQPEIIYFEVLIVCFLVLIFLLYFFAAIITNKKFSKWPWHRYVFWSLGIFCIGTALVGPLASYAHMSFVGHMIGHLLLGMLSPLLLALAKPMTLLLRSLNVSTARSLTSILKSHLLKFLTHPIIATTLNIGGLWLLYTTPLFHLMHQSIFLYAFVHLHVFLAGYLFTISIIYLDITPHQYSHLYRSLILIIALAAHKILSKYIYAFPTSGVPRPEAEAGSIWMYYGGDIIDLILIIILCYQWYKATTPRATTS